MRVLVVCLPGSSRVHVAFAHVANCVSGSNHRHANCKFDMVSSSDVTLFRLWHSLTSVGTIGVVPVSSMSLPESGVVGECDRLDVVVLRFWMAVWLWPV